MEKEYIRSMWEDAMTDTANLNYVPGRNLKIDMYEIFSHSLFTHFLSDFFLNSKR